MIKVFCILGGDSSRHDEPEEKKPEPKKEEPKQSKPTKKDEDAGGRLTDNQKMVLFTLL